MFLLGASSGGAVASNAFYQSIQTQTLATATSTITFTSIPATFTHLQIRGGLNGTAAGTYNNVNLRFNSDSGSNYSTHTIYGDGTTGANSEANGTRIYGAIFDTQASAASYLGVAVIDILDYANTNKYKTTKALSGVDLNTGGGNVAFGSGNWRSTNAITSITFSTVSGNFNVGSTLALYGIKVAV